MLRWFHLDLARGLTILGMILVNHPGSWSHIYPPLKHAAWHGLTFADLVFPSFLFLMGTAVAAAHSLKDSPLLTLRSFRRFCLLFALGLALNFIPAMDFHSLRIPGVLQRIAVVYLAVILLRKLPVPLLWISIAVILTGYTVLIVYAEGPTGLPFSEQRAADTWAAFSDRLLGEQHLWRHSRTWDPEGVLTTVPAICTGLLGYLAGRYFVSKESPPPFYRLLPWFLILLGAGWMHVFPFNKNLWSSSYVLATAGLIWALLQLVPQFVPERQPNRQNRTDRFWQSPFWTPVLFMGRNSLIFYICTVIWAKLDAGFPEFHKLIFDFLLGLGCSKVFASLNWALLNVGFWWMTAALLVKFKQKNKPASIG